MIINLFYFLTLIKFCMTISHDFHHAKKNYCYKNVKNSLLVL